MTSQGQAPASDFANMNNNDLRAKLIDMWNQPETGNQAYQALDTSHNTLQSQHAALQTQVQAAVLQPQVNVPHPQIHVTSNQLSTTKAPKIPKPKPFKGDRGPPGKTTSRTKKWKDFQTAFETLFFDPDEKQTATQQLVKLHQTKSTVEYASEFRQIIAILEWTEESQLRHTFYKITSRTN